MLRAEHEPRARGDGSGGVLPRPLPSAAMADALAVEGLTVTLGRAEIVRSLSFRVPEGTSLAIIGPNGSGKTVLLRALVGSVPSRGRIEWMAGARLGYVPQKLDIGRDVPLSGMDLLLAKKAVAKGGDEVLHVLDRVGLRERDVQKPIGTLSGGQFQRLLVGLALLGRPRVLLLDEPTSGVDIPGQERLNELIRRVQQEEGLTVLLVSHDLSVVFRYADNVLCLARERAWFGPPRHILTPELLTEVYGAPVEFHVHDD